MYEEILLDQNKSKVLARIIAHLMGDGNVSLRYLRYNNTNIFLLNQFKQDMGLIFGKIHFIEGKANSGTSFVQVQNKQLILFIKSLVKDFKSYYLLNNANILKSFRAKFSFAQFIQCATGFF